MEYRFPEALDKIEVLKNEVKNLQDEREVGGSKSLYREREARVEAPRQPMFKGVRNAQEVENFLWYMENYFKYNRVRSDVNKINTVVLYLSEMPML